MLDIVGPQKLYILKADNFEFSAERMSDNAKLRPRGAEKSCRKTPNLWSIYSLFQFFSLLECTLKTMQFPHTHSHHSLITSTWGQAFRWTWASAAAAGCFGRQRFWEEIGSGPGAASEWEFRGLHLLLGKGMERALYWLRENALKTWGDDDNPKRRCALLEMCSSSDRMQDWPAYKYNCDPHNYWDAILFVTQYV